MSTNLPALIESQRQSFLTVRIDKHMDFDREAGEAEGRAVGAGHAPDSRESLLRIGPEEIHAAKGCGGNSRMARR
jgi:hypothetical protein